ncbi:hypothetical protein ACHAXT_006171 [Thalassiosira profunda]
MRFNTAAPLFALAVAPTLTQGFHVASRPAATGTSTSLAMRRSMFPVLRRGGLFRDIDSLFREMDELMESSLASYPRPSLSLPEALDQRRPLGFKIEEGESEYQMAIHAPDVEAKDLDLQLDHDGRVLRLKGERITEDGGMKVQSRFEKAFLLPPDVDTEKLAASLDGDTLSVVAPKIKEEAPDEPKSKKIEISTDEPKAALESAMESDVEKAPTRLAVENLKDEKAEMKKSVDPEQKWPTRDFPY